MRRFVLAAVMACIAHGAFAADLPDLPALRGFLSDTPRAVRTNWEGFYVGGQGGFSNAQMNFGRTPLGRAITNFVTNDSQFFTLSPVALPGFPTLDDTTSKTTGFGGFVGYNAQWDDAVIGVEANYSHLDLKGSATATRFSPVVNSGGFAYQAISDSNATIVVHDLGTLRVRGGWSVGSFMPYAFAGLALARGDVTRTVTGTVTRAPIAGQVQIANPAPPIGPISAADNISNRLLSGYTAGVGTEIWLFGSVFARAEYEYVRLMTAVDVNINTIRGGIGYKF